MNEKEKTKVSRFISLVLRHDPSAAGLTLDKNGWVDFSELCRQIKLHFSFHIKTADIKEVVDTNDKKRFEIRGSRIRASQGHSIEVELGYESVEPPPWLYHGTAKTSRAGIYAEGKIDKRGRHALHLSDNTTTALQVGSRHGDEILFAIKSGKMYKDGYSFYQSANGVWLTDHVPLEYLVEFGSALVHPT